MNVKQAKQLPMPYLLSRLGFEPVRTEKGGNELWYLSPFREEREPSLHISRGHTWPWVWKDFGDEGGTVIDFVMRYKKSDLRQALQFLDSFFPTNTSSNSGKKREETTKKQETPLSYSHQHSSKPKQSIMEESKLELLNIRPLSHPAIFQYLEEIRCIPKELASKYLVEVSYRNRKNNKDYFAFGMENESGGYEIRAASDHYRFKSALNGRDITLIKGILPNSDTINVFEGMTDFLSLLVMMNTTNLSGDSLILHSLSSFGRASEILQGESYDTINTFLDNNRAGEEGTDRFLKAFPGQAISQSSLFAPHTDLNDALKANQIPDFLSASR